MIDVRGAVLVGVRGRSSPASTARTRRRPTCVQFNGYCINGAGNPPCTAPPGAWTARGTYTGLGMINSPRSKHPGGVNVGMCDGSVRFIKNSVNINIFQALASTRGGEVISADAY